MHYEIKPVNVLHTVLHIFSKRVIIYSILFDSCKVHIDNFKGVIIHHQLLLQDLLPPVHASSARLEPIRLDQVGCSEDERVFIDVFVLALDGVCEPSISS